jgi:[ribosomal protein S5]-alanine N-acetyltransferase
MLHLNFSPFPELHTERLVLRALRTDDANALHLMRTDVVVNQYLDRPVAANREGTLDFIAKIQAGIEENRSLFWVIDLKDTGQLAGSICLWNIVPEADQAEIGYEMLPVFHGQGIMQEAIAAVLAWAIGSLKVKKILGISHRDNAPSIRVLERNGFVRDLEMERLMDDLPEEEVVYVLDC